MTREDWLQQITSQLRPYFAAHSLTIPEVHLSVGWPSKGAFAKSRRRVGECWQPQTSKDGKPHIFISPVVEDGVEAAAVLVHELIHACLPTGTAHKGPFKRAARDLGLEGPATGTTAGDALKRDLADIIASIGPYPHAGLDKTGRSEEQDKKQSTRMLKLKCPGGESHEDDYIVRASRKVIEIGLPVCPCGKELVLEESSEEGE